MLPKCHSGEHDWYYGERSMWCLKCRLVKPYHELRKNTPRMKAATTPDQQPMWQPRRTKNGPGKASRLKVIERDGLICRYCEQPVVETRDETRPDRLTIDHITPRMLGGTNALENLCVACNACNNRKGAQLPHQFQVTPSGELTKRQRAALANAEANRHTRSHLRSDGTPKKGFDRDDAYDTASMLAERDRCVMEAFECDQCRRWHIRILPGAAHDRAVRRRAQQNRFYDEMIVAELGERVLGNLKGENTRTRRHRRDVISGHGRGANRRAKHKAAA